MRISPILEDSRGQGNISPICPRSKLDFLIFFIPRRAIRTLARGALDCRYAVYFSEARKLLARRTPKRNIKRATQCTSKLITYKNILNCELLKNIIAEKKNINEISCRTYFGISDAPKLRHFVLFYLCIVAMQRY